MNSSYTNELIHESSPYLLSHAHNPVDWLPWGTQALQLAANNQKPILLSIGYSACHWCHVMEKESFADPHSAAFMNKYFVNIKVDREERPDIDQIYMDAVQKLTGSGGWPLNVFLTPEGKPFYGGTYFPPQPMHGRASWMDVLSYISDIWTNKNDLVLQQADTLISSLLQSVNRFSHQVDNENQILGFSANDMLQCKNNVMSIADKINGGFGNAPKFPQFLTLQFLMAYGYNCKDEESTAHALLSLRKMVCGGIYDQLGGGLSRYSTDDEWLVPHFEKMLYDNAMLIHTLSEAYQISNDEEFKKGIHETIEFCDRELKSSVGAYYSSIDADSEGEEGRYYVWNESEIKSIAGEDYDIAVAYWNVTARGNWEDVNVLNRRSSIAFKTAETDLGKEKLNNLKKKLLSHRENRVRPSKDTKLILSWNAMMIIALSKAGAALNETKYRQKAEALFDSIDLIFRINDCHYSHTDNKRGGAPIAFLDDYALLIEACLCLQEITGNQKYIDKAVDLLNYVDSNFQGDSFYNYSHRLQKDTIYNNVDLYDLTIPSGNSTMAKVLLQLGLITDNIKWKQHSLRMLSHMRKAIQSHPLSLSNWALIALMEYKGIKEIVVTGLDYLKVLHEINALYLPPRVIQSSDVEKSYPLLKSKAYNFDPLIYVCENFSCKKPLKGLDEFIIAVEN